MTKKRHNNTTPLYRVWARDNEEATDAAEYGAIDVERAAQIHATYGHSQRDWWELTWPVVFYVIDPADGRTYAVEVEREMVAEFRPSSPLSLADFAPAVHDANTTMCTDIRLPYSVKEWPAGHTAFPFDEARKDAAKLATVTCVKCRKKYDGRIKFLADVDVKRKEIDAERAKERGQ